MYLKRKKHIFKKRRFPLISFFKKINFGSIGFYTPQRIFFELVYFRLLRKLFRRKYIRKRVYLLKPQYWFLIKPNVIKTKKAKNARMGAGVGKFVRVFISVYPGKFIVCFRGFNCLFLKNLKFFFLKHYPFKLNFAAKKNYCSIC